MRIALGAYEAAVRARALALAPEWERVWRRDASFWGDDTGRLASVSNRLGWLDVASAMQNHAAAITAFAVDVRRDGFRDAVVLGMGGSSLAPLVLARSIAQDRADGPSLHVLDSTDPATILNLLRGIDPARTLFFVSSKSGTTIEALALHAFFDDAVREALPGADPGSHFVAITDPGTPLQDLAAARGFRRVFLNPADIGGRYSALSYFGLVPAAVAGVDVARLLESGAAAEAAAHHASSDAVLLGCALGELALAGRNKCTLLLSPAISSFGLWVEQLIAESTGKEGRGILPVDVEPPGTPATYGDDRAFVYVRLDGDANGGLDATAAALEADGAPLLHLDLDTLYDLGAEFFSWELAVAVAGRVLGINPFDEPNVQESKDNTTRMLAAPPPSSRDAVDAADAPALVAALEQLLATATPPAYLALLAYLPQTPAAAESLAEIRRTVRDASGVATTLGFGPRYLHSTGQLHKGGPPQGIFLQITADHQQDARVPGRDFTFGRLNDAQAAGDLLALKGRGRPTLRVHLGHDQQAGLQALLAAVHRAADRLTARKEP